MDAAEEDTDIKLYKASGELLFELQAKVPRLVKAPNGQFRKWILSSKLYEVTHLLDAFQEWPQLLDPYLAKLIQILVDAYLSYCTQHSSEYVREHNVSDVLSPLPTAVTHVLYAFCKVRGRKVIVRLLNNEPKYVEPLLSCFRLWTSDRHHRRGDMAPLMTWEERYIHLLWLSHLMLAPFELSTISGLSVNIKEERRFSELCEGLPDVSTNLTLVGLEHLHLPSKAREAASALLVRLALRTDMQKLGLVGRLVHWAVEELSSVQSQSQSTGYHFIGLLELLFGITNVASNSEVAPFLNKVFHLAYMAAISSDKQFESIRDYAPARKLLVKLMRATVVHALTIENSRVFHAADIDLNTMLENCIQTMLDFLADKDTPVRQAASKALGLICLRLDADMSSQVVEAIIDSLDENVLLEDIKDGMLFPITHIAKSMSSDYKKNLNAVDPLKWHGCMLTLGHLLFRRSLPTSQLPPVIEAVLMGLNFEQRSNVGTSVGVGVRDAACFGIWSLARKYSTSELNTTSISTTLIPNPPSFANGLQTTTLQLIAIHLVMSACLDPSGNLRRGSSAALQELIGRHPDVIENGIPVVQTVDYHAVARRSRAVIEVAVAASRLSDYYHGALLYALLGWRGARASDTDSRRNAAEAAGLLVSMASISDILQFTSELIAHFDNLKPSNSGTNAAARHGLLCILASLMDNISQGDSIKNVIGVFTIVKPFLQDLDNAMGTISGRVTADIENVLEGISKVVLAATRLISRLAELKAAGNNPDFPSQWASSLIPTLELCTISSDKNHVTEIAANANIAVLKMLEDQAQSDLLMSWLSQKRQGKTNFTCKGSIATLGIGFHFVRSMSKLREFVQPIILYMNSIVTEGYPIESKVNAMQSIDTILTASADLEEKQIEVLANAVLAGLSDYTIDNRGDIGSLLRMESIDTAKQLLVQNVEAEQKQQTLQLLTKLAAEKMVKVRFQAWRCLQEYLRDQGIVTRTFDHQADISSFEYFRTLLILLQQPHYRKPLLLGLMTSIAGGTEEVSRACSQALIAFFQDQDASNQQILTDAIIPELIHHTSGIGSKDDREVIPSIDFIAFLIEHVLSNKVVLSIDARLDHIWDMCQKVHTPTSTPLRLEAMIRLYSSLTILESQRRPALERLTRLLLHRWPKIRSAAADVIFLLTAIDWLSMCDWDAPVPDNKAAVLRLRKELGVTGSAVAHTVPKPALAA